MIRLHHAAIQTRDLARLEAFYTQALGLSVALRWGDLGIVFLDAGGAWIELCQIDRLGAEEHPHRLDEGAGLNHVAFCVAQLESAYHALLAAGAAPIAAPRQYRSLRIAFVADPDGNVVELVEAEFAR